MSSVRPLGSWNYPVGPSIVLVYAPWGMEYALYMTEQSGR